MICPWCKEDYPVEFFEEHHLNHIHEDDRPENKIDICVKCHKRHHFESGYDTVIIKKSDFVPKTLEEQMAQIDREVFLQTYRESRKNVFDEDIRNNDEKLYEWVKNNERTPYCGKPDKGFSWGTK